MARTSASGAKKPTDSKGGAKLGVDPAEMEKVRLITVSLCPTRSHHAQAQRPRQAKRPIERVCRAALVTSRLVKRTSNLQIP